MHILLVADGRSPITRSWVEGILALQHTVTLVSTYPCAPLPGVSELHILPVAFAGYAGSQLKTLPAAGEVPSKPSRASSLRSTFLSARYSLGPLTLPVYGRRLKKIIEQAKPDLVHALRIPFEGMLATAAQAPVPLAVSIWGNDLTLHARRNHLMHIWSSRTLRRANGLLADARRDLRLGEQFGFHPDRSSMVLPGNGGIDLVEMHRRCAENPLPAALALPPDLPVVLNPRGFRPGSVRNDVFFEAMPRVLDRKPEVLFVCTGMAGQPEALKWAARLKLGPRLRLLPYLPQAQLWNLFGLSQVSVSVSSHDGTPNSLLEAMALGCFPVAGDIESLREWITPGVNGMLVEPNKPQAVSEAVIAALDNPSLRTSAAALNLERINQRAEVSLVRSQMEVFYQRVAGG